MDRGGLDRADTGHNGLHTTRTPWELPISPLRVKRQIKKANALQIQTENLRRGACLCFSNQAFEAPKLSAVFVKRGFLFRLLDKRIERNQGIWFRYSELMQKAERHSSFGVRYAETT